MTDEEVERAIETLLNNQANFELQLEKTNQQIERTNQQLGILADSQNEFTQIAASAFESQAEVNANLRASLASLAETVSKLAATVERYLGDGGDGKP
jgi:ABC-type transporter Mla subunit MlaD